MPPGQQSTFSIVPSPPALPPVTGLIASLSGQYLVDDTNVTVDGHPNRWEGGLQYNPEQQCYSGPVQDPCAVSGMDIPPNPGLVQAMPFIAWAGDKCSTFGWEGRDYRGRAQRALLACESKQIAHELWTGLRTKASAWPNPYLANPSAVIMSASPRSVSDGLAMLEQGLADMSTGGPGMIHVTRQLGLAISELGNVFRTVNGIPVTYAGTLVVADAGYPGSGPAGQPAANTQWGYATQMVTVRRSPIQVIPDTFAEATIKGTNFIEWRAERLAVATFPPCTLVACEFAVPVPAGMVS